MLSRFAIAMAHAVLSLDPGWRCGKVGQDQARHTLLLREIVEGHAQVVRARVRHLLDAAQAFVRRADDLVRQKLATLRCRRAQGLPGVRDRAVTALGHEDAHLPYDGHRPLRPVWRSSD